jgi:hypothetical protein
VFGNNCSEIKFQKEELAMDKFQEIAEYRKHLLSLVEKEDILGTYIFYPQSFLEEDYYIKNISKKIDGFDVRAIGHFAAGWDGETNISLQVLAQTGWEEIGCYPDKMFISSDEDSEWHNGICTELIKTPEPPRSTEDLTPAE